MSAAKHTPAGFKPCPHCDAPPAYAHSSSCPAGAQQGGAAKIDAKHTPGPWTAEKRSGDEWWFGGHDGAEIVVRDPANMHDAICVIGASLSTEGKADADARLIAAAPELLAALDYVIRDIELRSNFKRGDQKGLVDIGNGAYMQAKAALAKATGESA